jgi:hypothetical protein
MIKKNGDFKLILELINKIRSIRSDYIYKGSGKNRDNDLG